MKKVIFHIDVNSAFLSWEAAYRLQHGEKQDLREIPCVIGGDSASRRGIVLAKSIPAKAMGITTGESLFAARKKCPMLKVVSPDYDLYTKASKAMFNMIETCIPSLQIYSIDECFADLSTLPNIDKNFMKVAANLKNRIRTELGFTVNIGISENKLLAKMASDFKKPDQIHTLFPEEIEEKMWPLDAGDLFMAGRATVHKLKRMGIMTIGDIAKTDRNILLGYFKKHGETIWRYANGLDISEVERPASIKGIGNSTTLPFDVTERETAHRVLLSLCEMTGMRLRQEKKMGKVFSVSLKTNDFLSYSHQQKIFNATDSTNEIYVLAKKLFDDAWQGQPLRLLGIRISDLCACENLQISFFDSADSEKKRRLDETIDQIREKHGLYSITRSAFLESGLKPISGGVHADYKMVSGHL
ncbi:MAG: DNA polymerase IV [Peptostreptococcaceae bacterium]|nr:DNA polymerase IV [Peptostreptococcaceae bacterium]